MDLKTFFTARHPWWDYVGLGALALSVAIGLLYLMGMFSIGDEPQEKPRAVIAPTRIVHEEALTPPLVRVVDPMVHRLGFIVVTPINGQAPLIYEAVKGPVKMNNLVVFYTNSEGAERQSNGTYFYSSQPIKVEGRPLIATQTSAQFRTN